MTAETDTYDVAVLGAGGAGLATALFAALKGLRPIVIERTELIGGSTAFSAGSLWIPGTAAGRQVNPDDTIERAAAYLRAVAGNHADEARQRRFLALGAEAVAVLAQASEVHLRPYALHPDYLSDLEGATLRGRALEPVPFDGRRLGADLARVRPPIPEFTLLGGMMVDRTDIRHLLNMTRSFASLRHVAALVARHLADRVSGRRSSRMVMGNALVGRLLASLKAHDVPIWCGCEVTSLVHEDGRVTGVTLQREGRHLRLGAPAVVLAGGGFTRHPELRRRLTPDVETYIPGAPGHTGGLIDLALGLGARLGDEGQGHALWTPVSVRQRRDGSRAVFPHFVLDRAKPGTLMVNRQGRRFHNESVSYHDSAKAMIAAAAVPAFLIADRRAVKAYGLGMVRPGGWGLRSAIRDGYVVSAGSLSGLAAALDMPAEALEESVARMNDFARTGVDADFGRGQTAYQRNLGDPAVAPNPCLGPITNPPFYAVRLYPGDIAASTGLVTDGDARVLGTDGPIAGLFAVGNDMHSVMAGSYPGPGTTLGPGLAFAYAAAAAAAADAAAREKT